MDLSRLSGSGGLPIDSAIPLNFSDPIKENNDGTVWLKSGFVETDSSKYPDAYGVYQYLGFNFAAPNHPPRGILWDGSFLWIGGAGGAGSNIYKYTKEGIATGESFSVAGQDGNFHGIAWNGNNLFVVGATTAAIYKYSYAGVYSGESYSVTAQDSNPTGIVWDGEHFWVIGNATDQVFKYTEDFIYTGFSFSVAEREVTPYGIAWDGTNLVVIGSITSDNAHAYDREGNYKGVLINVQAQDTSPTGITWYGQGFFAVGNSTDKVYQYPKVVGMATAKVDSASGGSGLPYYVRVK